MPLGWVPVVVSCRPGRPSEPERSRRHDLSWAPHNCKRPRESLGGPFAPLRIENVEATLKV
jgi:hypothetical protein